MAQFHDHAETYLDAVRAELPLYDELQTHLALASAGLTVARMLDLGAGTGETSRRCIGMHPGAVSIAVDSSAPMLALGAASLGDRLLPHVGLLEDALPDGPFDLVVSALAVHHLNSAGKADLFQRINKVLAPEGRFILADVVIPEYPVAMPTRLDPTVDLPDRVSDLTTWLQAATFNVELVWSAQDLVVLAASPV